MDQRAQIQSLITEGDCVALLERWVRINTENPPGLEKALAEAIHAQLTEWGFESELFEVLPGRPDVIAVLRGTEGTPRLLFNGHTDVVPAGERSQWTVTDPYTPIVKDGKLYGRGGCDQKGGLLAQTLAARPPVRRHGQSGDGRWDHGAFRGAHRTRGPCGAGLLCGAARVASEGVSAGARRMAALACS
jgi:acetylornithine deacetylase/succinyl-diaminopimelate desuccinylase-like protein